MDPSLEHEMSVSPTVCTWYTWLSCPRQRHQKESISDRERRELRSTIRIVSFISVISENDKGCKHTHTHVYIHPYKDVHTNTHLDKQQYTTLSWCPTAAQSCHASH
jgi:hypothetical protein